MLFDDSCNLPIDLVSLASNVHVSDLRISKQKARKEKSPFLPPTVQHHDDLTC